LVHRLLELAAPHAGAAQQQLDLLRRVVLADRTAAADSKAAPAAGSTAAGMELMPAEGSSSSSDQPLPLGQCTELLGRLNMAMLQAHLQRAGATAVAAGTATPQRVEQALQRSLAWRGHAPAVGAASEVGGAGGAAASSEAAAAAAAAAPAPGVKRGRLRIEGRAAAASDGAPPAKRQVHLCPDHNTASASLLACSCGGCQQLLHSSSPCPCTEYCMIPVKKNPLQMPARAAKRTESSAEPPVSSRQQCVSHSMYNDKTSPIYREQGADCTST
jgi:hypothetical protein